MTIDGISRVRMFIKIVLPLLIIVHLFQSAQPAAADDPWVVPSPVDCFRPLPTVQEARQRLSNLGVSETAGRPPATPTSFIEPELPAGQTILDSAARSRLDEFVMEYAACENKGGFLRLFGFGSDRLLLRVFPTLDAFDRIASAWSVREADGGQVIDDSTGLRLVEYTAVWDSFGYRQLSPTSAVVFAIHGLVFELNDEPLNTQRYLSYYTVSFVGDELVLESQIDIDQVR